MSSNMICNQPVAGSSPISSSKEFKGLGGFRLGLFYCLSKTFSCWPIFSVRRPPHRSGQRLCAQTPDKTPDGHLRRDRQQRPRHRQTQSRRCQLERPKPKTRRDHPASRHGRHQTQTVRQPLRRCRQTPRKPPRPLLRPTAARLL